MRRAGCWQIAYGIESGSQRVLDVVKHEVKLPRMLETLRLTRAAGIRAKGLLMMAHPTESEDSLRETVDVPAHAPLDLVQMTKFTPVSRARRRTRRSASTARSSRTGSA